MRIVCAMEMVDVAKAVCLPLILTFSSVKRALDAIDSEVVAVWRGGVGD